MKNLNNLLSVEENKLLNKYKNIVGIDEVGRGSIFGPVVACSVLLDEKFLSIELEKIKDSKKLSEKKRNYLVNQMIEKECTFGLGFVENKEIDDINIKNASELAMKKSIQNINKNIDAALVDGISKIPGIEIYQESIISGDNKCKVIGAASIMAKFIRDFIIKKYDRIFPFYKLSQNAGYGTAEHVKGIKVYGKSFMHRKSFKIKLIDS